MELLAPAGSVEHFTAALDAGADAVYVGAPMLNARNPSKELRFEEIAAMVDYARARDKRVYVALNSLVREDDLSRLVQTLSYLDAINPHGLIVQDLGVIEVIRHHFKTITIHASTLMFAHSSSDVEILADLGCSRVVLARELTLKEIGTIVRASPVEIEVFVHGAMCFSYSGRCLFSSYHGGKSGLRGNCVQPCRRKFTIGSAAASAKGRKAGIKSGYVFSMNDLEGIDFIDDFKRMGVASIKIEGRLKPVAYVRHVVEAYRLAIDADNENKSAALAHARELIEASLGRRRSTGYFLEQTPKDAIVSSHSGNIGTHLGALSGHIQKDGNTWAVLRSKETCREGDRLRLHCDQSGERTAFTARQVEQRDDGNTAVLLPAHLDRKQLQGKVDLYRVDTVKKPGSGTDVVSGPLKEKPFTAREIDTVNKRSNMVRRRLAGPGYQVQPKSNDSKRKSGKHELWLRLDATWPIYQNLPFAVDRFIIPINKKTLSETGQLNRYFGKNRNKVIWTLPPIVHTHRKESLQRDVAVLIRSGFRSFQIGTLGQINLFKEKHVSLFGDFSLNVLNSRTMRMITELGLKGLQFSIETDRAALKQALGNYRMYPAQAAAGQSWNKPGKGLVGLTVYGSPALFMSRIPPPHVSFNQSITSPKQERYLLQKIGGASVTRPEKPFSLLPFRKELETMGIDYMVIDLSGIVPGKKELQDIARRIDGKERMKKLPAFNFDGKLE